MTAGAIEAHRNGIVTACSIVANGRAFDDAVDRLRDVPALEIGVHLTLVEERSLTTGEPMPRNWIRFLISPRRDIEGELRLQIEKAIASRLKITHLNSHQHLHMLPSIFSLVMRLAAEYGIPYVRNLDDRGGPLGLRRLAAALLGKRRGKPPHSTIGFVEAGQLTAGGIIKLLDHVGDATELVAHPGLKVSGYEHWRYAWDEETRALCDPRVRAAIVAKDIQLVAPSHI